MGGRGTGGRCGCGEWGWSVVSVGCVCWVVGAPRPALPLSSQELPAHRSPAPPGSRPTLTLRVAAAWGPEMCNPLFFYTCVRFSSRACLLLNPDVHMLPLGLAPPRSTPARATNPYARQPTQFNPIFARSALQTGLRVHHILHPASRQSCGQLCSSK